MFQVNRKTDYAVRVMLSLARRPIGTRLSAEIIQNEMLIPHAILKRIIAELAQAGLLHTYPGPGGGAELALPAESITLLHIWEAIEGPILVSECLGMLVACPLDVSCPVQSRWARLQVLIVDELEATTLSELAYETMNAPLKEVIDPLG